MKFWKKSIVALVLPLSLLLMGATKCESDPSSPCGKARAHADRVYEAYKRGEVSYLKYINADHAAKRACGI